MLLKPRVLIIESDRTLCQILETLLQDYELTIYHDLPDRLVLTESFDLLIMDEELPSGSGSDFLLHSQHPTRLRPVIFISSPATKELLFKCLNMGVFKFIEKPFNTDELTKLIRQLTQSQVKTFKLDSGLFLKLDQRQVFFQDEALGLTPLEYQIVEILATHPQKCFSKRELLNLIWSENKVAENTIETHLSNLKKKHTVFRKRIKNVRARGYYWDSK